MTMLKYNFTLTIQLDRLRHRDPVDLNDIVDAA
jgi:hypothetical protein